MRKPTILFTVVAIVLGSNPAKSSGTPFLSFDLGASTYTELGAGTIGWEFIANAPISVSQIGYLDALNPGLISSHEVAIWSASGDLVATTTVQSGTSSDLVDSFRYEAIYPIVLQQGETYIIGGSTRAADGGISPLRRPARGLAVSSAITVIGGRTNRGVFGGGDALSFPREFFRPGSNQVYLGPNFIGVVVPEPHSASIVFGFAACSLRVRRERTC
ncbi:hypothetical protein MalM25_06420 [Planctomycetes bacterium MalM25]|nr:hypothetical protein MalM25_06420 [Planctomycetes bacterium MalM25]